MDPAPLCDALHIRPDNDVIDHEWEDCACLPILVEIVGGYVFVHNAWDGRP